MRSGQRSNRSFRNGRHRIIHKIREQQRGILLGYKHYIETGEKNVPVDNIIGRVVVSVA